MRGQKVYATFIENSFMLYEPSWIFVTVDEFHNTSKEEWFRLQAPSSKSRAATTGKAPKAWALPWFWVSIRSFKEKPVKNIWGRIGPCLAQIRRVGHEQCMAGGESKLFYKKMFDLNSICIAACYNTYSLTLSNQIRFVAFNVPQLTQVSFLQINQTLQNGFWISVMLRWHRASVTWKNQSWLFHSSIICVAKIEIISVAQN